MLNAPSQRSNAKIYLSSGSASLQTFQETDTKICETSVDYPETESNAGVCYELRILKKSVKQRFHFNSRSKFDNMNLGETNVTLTHCKQQMSVETFFYLDVIVECDRST